MRCSLFVISLTRNSQCLQNFTNNINFIAIILLIIILKIVLPELQKLTSENNNHGTALFPSPLIARVDIFFKKTQFFKVKRVILLLKMTKMTKSSNFHNKYLPLNRKRLGKICQTSTNHRVKDMHHANLIEVS